MPKQKNLLLQLVSAVALLILLAGCGDTVTDSSQSNYTPKGLIATSGTRTVTLDWGGVDGASAYTVYWSHSEGVSKTNGSAVDTDIPHFEHRGLANNTPYYYVVTAHTQTGESRTSNRVIGTPQPAAPVAPVGFALTEGDTRVTLTWEQGSLGASAYSLYWDTQATITMETARNRIENVSPPFVHSSLSNGQTYYYILVAENQYGQSTATQVLQAQPQKSLPTAPKITAATVTSGTVEIQWVDHSNAESFDIYWNTQGAVSDTDSKITEVTSPYFHTFLNDGSNYHYRVQARNSGGQSALSNEVMATPPDINSVVIQDPAVSPPAVPQFSSNGSAFHDSRNTLAWDPVPGATGYNVYWKSVSAGVSKSDSKISNVQSPYTHIGLSNGTAYYYRVSAINDGGESDLSTEILLIPQVITPGVPAGVIALAGNGWIALRWTDVEQANGYNVQLNGITTANSVNSPYTITGLVNGTSYDVTVTALNGAQESAPSTPVVTVTPQFPPPKAPENVTAQPQDGQVVVQWDEAQPQDPSDTVTGYQVYYRHRSGVTPGNGRLINVTPTQNTDTRWEVTHSPLTNGQPYYYVVTAINASGSESRISQEVWARPQVATPGAPSNIWTQAGDNQVVIHYTPAENALSHNLYWSKALAEGGRSDVQVITNFPSGSVFTDGASANGHTYYFKVSAFNNGGESARTPEVDATPQVSVPQTPPQNIATQSGNAQVSLDWALQADATLGYALYWSTEPEIDPSTLVPIEVDAATNTYTHSDLQNGQTYFYQIVAVNEGGESALSEAVTARPQVPPPVAPTQAPTANAGDAAITLTWTDVPSTSSYTLYRSTNVEAPIEQWARFDGVLSGLTQTSLSNNQLYYYMLTASNPGGESGASPTISATPLAPLPAAPTGMLVTSGDGQLSLDWDTVAGLSYTLYWNTDPNVDPVNDTNPPLTNVRPATVHTNLMNTTTYRYQIRATNATGDGAASVIVSGTPTGSVPNNQAPVIQEGASVNVTMDEDGSPRAFNLSLNATDADSDPLQWRVATPANNGAASVVAEGGFATVGYIPTGNFNGTDSFVIEVNDNRGGVATTQVNVTIDPVNDAPVFAGSINTNRQNQVGETLTGVTTITDIVATDIDGNSLNYSAINLPDGLSINTDTGAISGTITSAAEAASPYTTTITANDQTPNPNDGDPQHNDTIGLTWDIIGPANVAPTDITLTANNIAENSPNATPVGILGAVDSDGDTHSYSFVAPNNDAGGRFRIVGNELQVANSALLNFELNSTHLITVQAQDQGALVYSRDFTISVSDMNDVVPVISNLELSHNIPENSTAVVMLTIDDVDTVNDPFTYTLTGPDAAQFEVVNDNLQFKATAVPNYEIPVDVGINNVYNVSVAVNDGVNNSVAKDFVVSITNVAEDTLAATNLNAPETFIERSAGFTLTPIVVTSPDAAPVTLTLTPSTFLGALFIPNGAGVFRSNDAVTGVWTATGTAADLNVVLANVYYTPGPGDYANYSVSVTVSDGIRPDVSGTKSFTMTPIAEVIAASSVNVTPANPLVGDTINLDVLALDATSSPVAVTVKINITGANPQTLTVSNPALGDYTASYVANNAGIDTYDVQLNLTQISTPTRTIDPIPVGDTWKTAATPANNYEQHTATLLPNGKVILTAGHLSVPVAELYDPETNSWSTAASFTELRKLHTATLLPNGKLLVVGGNNLGTAFTSAELYDSVTNTWSSAGNLTIGRYNHSATLLPNGKVLIAGGNTINTGLNVILSSVELYDPDTNTWSAAPSLATARQQHSSNILPDGRLMITGGLLSGGSRLATSEIYDPVSNTWSTAASMSTARYQHTATLLPNGNVMISGGYSATVITDSVEIYDATLDIWSAGPNLLTARRLHSAIIMGNGKVMIMGGLDVGGGYLASAELYDPVTNLWTNAGTPEISRAFQTTTVLNNGNVLMVGGYSGVGLRANPQAELYMPLMASPNNWRNAADPGRRFNTTLTLLNNGNALVAGGFISGATLDTTLLYNYVTDSWTAGGNLLQPREQHTANILPNGKVLVVGGTGSIGVQTSAEIYDPLLNTWSSAANLTVGRYFHTSNLLANGKILVVGGGDSGTYHSSTTLYDPATNTWTAGGSMSTARYRHASIMLPNGKLLVTGGFNGNTNLSSIEIYDPVTNTFSAGASMTNARSGHKMLKLRNGNILVVAGYNTGTFTIPEIYDYITNTWATAATIGIPASYTFTLLHNGTPILIGTTAGNREAKLYFQDTDSWQIGARPFYFHDRGASLLLPSGELMLLGTSLSAPAELYGSFLIEN